MFVKISNSIKYNLIIVILKSIKLLNNSIIYVSSKIDSNLNNSIHFF